MENEQMNQQPTYDQLVQAYNNLVRELELVKSEAQAIKTDKVLERLQTMMKIVEHKEVYPDTVVKLALWHIKQIMAKPKR